jgi:hypothetical protein
MPPADIDRDAPIALLAAPCQLSLDLSGGGDAPQPRHRQLRGGPKRLHESPTA